MKFDKSYTDYWKNRVSSQSDGTKIADNDILNRYLPLLEIKPDEHVLDIGCSFGRFYNTLANYSQHISGLDIDPAATEQCRSLGYQTLRVCPMEQMDLQDESIDKAVCWATFDCVEQEQGLAEANRILKQGGRILITGKNISYHPDDEIAFIAERNAWLKDFPNHFTDVSHIDTQLSQAGFKLLALFCFERRGDFGQNKISASEVLPSYFYEYLIVLEKTGEVMGPVSKLCDRFSDTARLKSKEAGFDDHMADYFQWHKTTFPEG